MGAVGLGGQWAWGGTQPGGQQAWGVPNLEGAPGLGAAPTASPPRVPSGDRSHLRFSAAKESLTSKMLEAWLFPVRCRPVLGPPPIIGASWAGALGALELRRAGGTLSSWEPTGCALQGGPSGHDHIVVTGPAGPEELWELVWEHGAHVLVSLCPPDTWEQVRGAEGGRAQVWGRGRGPHGLGEPPEQPPRSAHSSPGPRRRSPLSQRQ